MKQQWIKYGLISVILLQLTVLVSEYLFSVYPLWTGKEVRLKTIPVDPRSLFRGNYALLRYDISTVSVSETSDSMDPRADEIIYVKLKPAENDLYVFDGASFDRPENGLFIRGRIESNFVSYITQPYTVKYGIEAYFAPKEKALALEKQLRDGGVAVIMLAENGKATLKSVVAEDHD